MNESEKKARELIHSAVFRIIRLSHFTRNFRLGFISFLLLRAS